MINFTNSPGNLFNRLGKVGLIVSQLDSYQTTQETNFINEPNGLVAQFDNESDIQAIAGSQYMGTLNSAGAVGALCQQVAVATINRVVFRDNPLINQTLQNQNTLGSIREVIRQMNVQGATILAATITATPTAFTGTGNGVVVVSTKRPYDGKVLENSFAENLTVTCMSSSYLTGATAGNEQMRITGTGLTGSFSFDWPLGSNCIKSTNVINSQANNGQGNLLTNSGFDTWASGAPSNWTVVTGTLTQENSIVYTGGSAILLTGDGSTLNRWYQQFDVSTGTNGSPNPIAQYGMNVFLRRDGTAAAAGVLSVELVDGNNTIIQDENGVNNALSIDLTALTTVYTAYNVSFRFPAILPSTMRIQYRLTTALTNARNVYIDAMSLGAQTQLYPSGPFVSVHAGSVPFQVGDYSTITVTNSRGAAGTLNTFQTLLARVIPEVYANGILFPSSSSPTISDALIG